MQQHIIGDGDTACRIPQREIRIRADHNASLARRHAENLGRIGCCQRHELLQGNPPLHHTFAEQDRHARGKPRQAIRDFGKGRIQPESRLAIRPRIARGRVIGAYIADNATAHRIPQRRMIGGRARRRAEDIFGAFKTWAIHVFRGQHQILRAGFCPYLQAALLRAFNFLGTFRARDMEDLDWHIQRFRHGADAMHAFAFHHHRL